RDSGRQLDDGSQQPAGVCQCLDVAAFGGSGTPPALSGDVPARHDGSRARVLLLMTRRELTSLVRALFVVATLAVLFVGILTNKFVNGRLKNVNPIYAVLPNGWLKADYKGIDVGPIPRGTPVNLLMNLDPAK